MLLGDIVRLNAQKAPGRTALIVDDREISFGTLHERMLRLANALLGVASKGDRVGILAENVPEYVEAYYGVPTAGMALTFRNYRLNPKEWAWILNNPRRGSCWSTATTSRRSSPCSARSARSSTSS